MSGKARATLQFTYCEDCEKRGYFSRKIARAAREVWHLGDKGVRPYECPAKRGLWHLGHMPSTVRRRGVISAAAAAEHSRRKREAS